MNVALGFIFVGLALVFSVRIPMALAEDRSRVERVVMDFAKPISLDSPGPGWRHRKFSRTTPMSMQLEENEGYAAIRLETEGGGSIFGRHVDIDLDASPILAWSWKVASPVEVGDETNEEGDDHPARLFLSFAAPEDRGIWSALRDWLFTRIGGIPFHGRSFEIVWGNNLREGELYYIHDFPHYVKRGGSGNLNRWWDEQVDLEQLYRRIWPGERVPKLLFVGLMNDTEIAREKAVSYFANVRVLGRR